MENWREYTRVENNLKPKVSILGPYFAGDGVANHIRNIVPYLSERFDLRIVSVGPTTRHVKQESLDIVQHSIPFPIHIGIQSRLTTLLMSATECRGTRLFHLHDPLLSVIREVYRTTPVVATVHGTLSTERMLRSGRREKFTEDIVRRIELTTYRMCDVLIVVHRELYDVLTQRYCVPARKIVMIPNGVNPEKFKPDNAARRSVRMKLGVRDDEFLVSCFKTLPKDDVETVVEAFALMLSKKAKIRLLVPWRDKSVRLHDIFAKNLLESRVILLDSIPYEDMNGFYNAADVNIIPSLKGSYFGGFASREISDLKTACNLGYASATNLTVMESLATATPTIVTLSTSKAEFLVNDIAVTVPSGSPKALADATLHLMNERANAKILGNNARKFVKDNFTWARIANRTADLYHQTLS